MRCCLLLFLVLLQTFALRASAVEAEQGADPIAAWLAGTAGPAIPAVPATGKRFEIKFSHPAPPASLVPPLFDQAADWMRRASAGRLRIRQYAGGSLHGASEGFTALRSGITDYATCYSLFEHRGFELNKIFYQPFLSPARPVVATRVFQELAPKYFAQEFERRGVLYGYSAYFQRVDLMSRKPVRRLEDLRGMKVIAMGMSPDTAKAYGFAPLNLPFPEIYTALSQGLADAVFWFDMGFVPYRIYEVAPHRTVVGLYAGAIDTCINRKTMQRMPADLQSLFRDYQQYVSALLISRAGIGFSQTAEAVYLEKGVTTHYLDAAERERWVRAGQPAVDAWLQKCDRAGKPCRALLRDVQALDQKYAPMSDEEILRLMIEEPVRAK